MKVSPTDKEGTTRESSLEVSPRAEEKVPREISSMMSHSSSEKPIEPSSQEAHTCDTKITFTYNDLLFGETLHNRPLYIVGHVPDKKINIILIDEGSGVNILPIHTLKELGIMTEELSENGIERKIVAYDNPFTEIETYFIDAKFYLKSYVVKGKKSNDVKSTKSDKITSKNIDTAVGKAKVDTKELCPNLNERKIMSSKKNLTSGLCYVTKVKKEEVKSSNLQEDALRGLTLPIRRIDAINLPPKLPGNTIAQNQVRDTGEGFDPNAYKLFVNAGYNLIEPSMLGKLPSVDKTRQTREGLGYNKPLPVRISIRWESNNYITFEIDVSAPNARTSVFERLGPLKKKHNKHRRSYLKVTTPSSSMIQKDFKSLILSRMRRRVELVVSCKEELKEKAHTVVYTNEREEDEESVGSSYHVTI
ncbi:hypothetical protein KY290_038328 [Solanum tuberosum]|uniref:Uncharacterized protein n=1 Tax=Solanum tuberosum TaxID=4113 RepID=A0ABQ7TZZ8_SOLTU|nr:hypothetical protein KY289_036088 [Solanum tuberosum]KAH0639338.1 hypothetical protein KY285_035924 [Solanum tuberosum]KAH0739623.1 hypothetical protein KY290_038328 [Solanum tuberosum]